jgi:hypothetical protein
VALAFRLLETLGVSNPRWNHIGTCIYIKDKFISAVVRKDLSMILRVLYDIFQAFKRSNK